MVKSFFANKHNKVLCSHRQSKGKSAFPGLRCVDVLMGCRVVKRGQEEGRRERHRERWKEFGGRVVMVWIS